MLARRVVFDDYLHGSYTDVEDGKDLPAQKKTVRARFECRHLQRFFVQHEFQPILRRLIPLIWHGGGVNGTGFRDEAMRREHDVSSIQVIDG